MKSKSDAQKGASSCGHPSGAALNTFHGSAGQPKVALHYGPYMN